VQVGSSCIVIDIAPWVSFQQWRR